MAASYMPMSEELEQPGRSWGDIIAERKAFKGYAESAMHKCTLCPEKKNIYSDAILAEHLDSKLHKMRLKERMDEMKSTRSKQVSKFTAPFRKLAMLSIHFKLLAQLKAYQ